LFERNHSDRKHAERPASRRPFCFGASQNCANASNFPDLLTWYRDTAARNSTFAGGGGMAGRFTIGKLLWPLKILRPRWGVRGSLFAAFAVIAGMAIVISAGAGMVLKHLGGTMVDLSGRDIPRLVASLQLAAHSAALASQGPALLSSESEDVLNERSKKMKEAQPVTLETLGPRTNLAPAKPAVAALTETVKNIDDTIKSLGSAARARPGP